MKEITIEGFETIYPQSLSEYDYIVREIELLEGCVDKLTRDGKYCLVGYKKSIEYFREQNLFLFTEE